MLSSITVEQEQITMANWDPSAANALMMFADGHGMTGAVNGFQTNIENWADALGGHSNQRFPFGNYTAEVTADPGQITDIQFDM